MGATVLLVDAYERVIGQALTNDRGIFGFGGLAPGLYAVRVSFAAFVPAIKNRIAVKADLQSLLYINLTSVFSSVELVYAAPGQGALMSDDWKWTLKSATSTRPILRLRDNPAGSGESPAGGSAFSDTTAMLRVSAGDTEGAWAGGMEADLGTAFALATSLYGRNRLQVSGNLGYTARTGAPNAGFRTTFSREDSPAELSITFRQVYLPTRFGASPASATGADGLPALRTLSLQFRDHFDLGDRLRLDYGSALDSISFIDNLNYASPYARLTYQLGSLGALRFGFSSGAPPVGLSDSSPEAETQLHQNLAALALLPAVSLRGGAPEVERSENFEIGYEKRLGSRTVRLSAYSESVSNATLSALAPAGFLPAGDMLPDLESNSAIFDIGNYRSAGYSATVTQAIGSHSELSAGYGGGDALAFGNGAAIESSQSALELRSRFHTTESHWASTRLTTTVPRFGTQISASYAWTPPGVIQPMRYSLTDSSIPLPGFNVSIRQPIPCAIGRGGRLEATADLQNMLAQGYVSLPAANGQRVTLTQMPRAVRGGLAIIF